tara:strand:- start:5473 stop:8604 length:3132 start_codon:yes stop_codon:yes gene_type:complete
MQHNSQQVNERLLMLAKRIRRLALLRAWAVLFVVTVASSMLCLFLDYLVRWSNPIAPILGSGFVIMSTTWTFFRSVLPSMNSELSPFAMALHIERKHPGFGQRLSSAISLSESDEMETRQFTNALLSRVNTELTEEVISGMVDMRRVRRSGISVLVFLFILIFLPVIQPTVISIAAQRLISPWDAPNWPRRHALKPVGDSNQDNPTQFVVALGEDFTVQIEDKNGRLPKQIWVEVWKDSLHLSSIEAEVSFMPNIAEVTLVNVREPFEFRISGGDDPGEQWYEVLVEIPPRVERIEFEIVAPEYTGLPPILSDGNLRILSGSQIVPSIEFSHAVDSAHIWFESTDLKRKVSLTDTDDVSGARQHLSDTQWQVDESGEYWIEYVTIAGAKTSTRPQRVIATYDDQPPGINVTWPQSELDVGLTGAANLTIELRDDIHVKRAMLVFSLDESDEFVQMTIPVAALPNWTLEQAADIHAGTFNQSQSIELLWDLSSIAGLYPGQRIAYHIVAEDIHGQVTESPTAYLRLVSSRQLIRSLQQKRVHLIESLRDLQLVQQDMISNTGTLMEQLDNEQVAYADVSGILQSVELHQGDIKRACSLENGSVRMQIRRVVEQSDLNRLSNFAERKRLSGLLDQLDAIHETHLVALSQLLSDLVDTTSSRTELESSEVQAQLARIYDLQTDAERDLENALSGYRSQLSYQQFTLGISELRQIQEGIGTDLRNYLGQQLVGLSIAKERIDQTARLQGDSAQELTQIVDNMKQWLIGESVSREDARFVADMLQVHSRWAISERMRQISRLIHGAGVQESLEQHELVMQYLEQMIDAQGASTEIVRHETHSQLLAVSAEDMHAIYRDLKALHEATSMWDGEVNGIRDELVFRQEAVLDAVTNIAGRDLRQSAVQFALSRLERNLSQALHNLTVPNRLVAIKHQVIALELIEHMVHVMTNSVSMQAQIANQTEVRVPGGESTEGEALLLSQVRLLIRLQADINQRVDEAYGDGNSEDLTDQQRNELELLAADQIRIADLVSEIRKQDLKNRTKQGDSR